MNKENLIPDEFTIMLKAVNKIVENPKSDIVNVKDELLELKQAAIDSNELNNRQREAITARVDNYLNNDYGDQRKKNKDHISDLAQIQETRKNKVNSNPK